MKRPVHRLFTPCRLGSVLAVMDEAMRWIWSLLLMLALAGPLAVAPVAPGLANDQDEARRLMREGKIMNYTQIKRRAEQMFKGRVVGQDLRSRGRSGWVYDLRIQRTDGQVLAVLMDARSGQVLSTRGGR